MYACIFHTKLHVRPLIRFLETIYRPRGRTGLRGGPTGQAVPGANLQWALRRQWNKRKYGANILPSFHTLKNFSENYPKFGKAPSKLFASLALGWRSLQNIGFKWRQTVSPGDFAYLFVQKNITCIPSNSSLSKAKRYCGTQVLSLRRSDIQLRSQLEGQIWLDLSHDHASSSHRLTWSDDNNRLTATTAFSSGRSWYQSCRM